ncbi:hypothetical protein G4L39_09525 [Limisphaera ngatamarikiensis]|uniref:Histidine kinase domain-containing protein n=1 Tax=Limisphaera ngatamarikiensis TaxID=1324935 RepID=A0A6M1RY13_9BACT|nr:sensor histidine kinase [Limisphaera ngatamarikiensis]NGO39632.1 hypothetical protein [Limisphaera ngatamarikiensis]
MWLALSWPASVPGTVLWSLSGPILARPGQPETVLVAGGLARDDNASDTLYLRFTVTPLDDAPNPEDELGLQLHHGQNLRLGVGKARGAVGYSVYLAPGPARPEAVPRPFRDLNSARPEPEPRPAGIPFEMPRRGQPRTLVLKIQFVPGGDDLLTVWLNPDLGPGANEVHQPETLRTEFYADASFDRILLAAYGTTTGWWFSELAIATTFADFVEPSSVAVKPSPSPPLHAPAFDIQSWPLPKTDPTRASRSLAITPEGYLWIAGPDGLLRFDKHQFHSVPVPAATSTPLRQLAADRTGSLWTVTDRGDILQLNHHGWTTHHLPEAPPGSAPLLTADGQGQLWLACSNRLWQWDGRQWTQFTSPATTNTSAISAVVTDPQGRVWILHRDRQIEQYTNNRTRLHLLPGPDLPPDATVTAWIIRPDQTHWLATPEQLWRGTARNENLSWELAASIGPGERILAVVPMPDQPPMAILNTGEWLLPATPSNPPARLRILPNLDGVTHLLVDTDGTLWAIQPDTLLQFRPRWRQTCPPADPSPAPVTGVVEVAPGTFWIAQPGVGLLRWTRERPARLNVAGMPPRDPLLSLLAVTRDGSCWLGTSAGLLRFKDPLAVADECQNLGFTSQVVRALTETGDDTLWIGTAEGELWRLTRGHWQQVTGPWHPAPITTLCPHNEQLWIGTAGRGLFRLDLQNPSLSVAETALPATHVFALYPAQGPGLWAATDKGLWCRDNSRWTRLYPGPGQAPQPVWAVVQDNQGRLWWAGAEGLACIPSPAPDTGLHTNGPWRIWPWHDPQPTPNPATARPVLLERDSEGRLWLARGNHLEILHPDFAPVQSRPLRVIIHTVRVNDRPITRPPGPLPVEPDAQPATATPLDLGAGARSVDLEFAILNTETDDLRISYRLEGLEDEWHTAGPARRVTYGHLRPGQYQFRIRAREASGPARTAETVLPLRVRPRLWQQPWFTPTVILATLLAGGAFAQTRERRRARRRLETLQREHALERERARIARDLHDEMGGKLCRISFLTEHLRRQPRGTEPDRHLLTDIGETARELLRALDEIVWAVNPANDTLEHLAAYLSQHAQDFFQGTSIECRVDLPETLPGIPLPGHIRHHLFLAVHEAFTNALKHSGASRVELRLECTPETMTWIVRDNGHGFEPAPAGPGRTGCGLQNLHTRMAELGGSCTVSSHPGQGTEIRLRLPLPDVHSTSNHTS